MEFFFYNLGAWAQVAALDSLLLFTAKMLLVSLGIIIQDVNDSFSRAITKWHLVVSCTSKNNFDQLAHS